MAKQPENEKTTVSIPSKIDEQFRRQAFNMKLTLGELFLKYREAYLREQEREKAEKKLKKQQAEQEKNK